MLAESDRRNRARELVEEVLAARPARASGTRLIALRAWLRSLDGDDAGAVADVTRAWEEAGDEPQHLLRREWPRLEPLLWRALEVGALAPASVVAALEAALPGGAAVLAFTRHPVPEVRRVAVLAAVASGHPGAVARAKDLQADPDPAVASAAHAARARLKADPPPLAFTVLGGFSVRRGTYEVDDDAWPRRAAQRLVRILLMHRDAAMSEDALFAALWPDKSGAAARRNLQVIVSTVRAVLDWPGTQRGLVLVARRSYRLGPRGTRRRGRRRVRARGCRRARCNRRRTHPALLEAAASRWTGEPLPEDRYEDWAVPGRERLLDVYGRLLDGARGRPLGGGRPCRRGRRRTAATSNSTRSTRRRSAA